MSNLDAYLAQHFQNEQQFASECGLSVEELADLLRKRLIPQASYVVSNSTSVTSYLFGEMPAPASINGRYFHPLNKVWVLRALAASAVAGPDRANRSLKSQFLRNFRAALVELNSSTWRLCDSFKDDGLVIQSGLNARLESAWEHFLQGTFGLCVANPISEAAIAWKLVLQEKLAALSDNGTKAEVSSVELNVLLITIDAYRQATMPFSPVEYSLSSRKRLVDGLTTRVLSANLV